MEITEVLDLRNGEYVLNPIYTFVKRGQDKENITGTLEKVGELKCRDKLDRAGIRL